MDWDLPELPGAQAALERAALECMRAEGLNEDAYAQIRVTDDETIRQAFSIAPKDNTVFLPKIMSRKKQVIPMLSALWG